MEKLFLSVLNMGVTAGYVIAAIMLARLCLKRAPKAISYALWAVAGFRLVFPFSFESALSLIPFNSTPIPADIAMRMTPRFDSGLRIMDDAVSRLLPAGSPATSMNPLQLWQAVGTLLWLVGIAVMLIYSVVSILLLKRRLRGARPIEDNVYETGNIKTPFVLGLLRPKIYLPTGLSAEEKRYILLHERTHIRRCDHFVKLLAYFILCLHWFNPFVWAAFLLMGADMEMSCDERVLKTLGGETKKAYSLSLLSLATGRRIIGTPLAFGEGGVKGRIKNVLNFKKPSRVIVIAAVVLAVALSVGFAVNRAMPVTGDKVEEGNPNLPVAWVGNLEGKPMTLDDVRELGKKGDSLVFEDLLGFKGANVSSNFDRYIMVYGVEGGYRLVVRSAASGKPDSVDLESIWESGGSGIDIRYGDVDKFIKNHPSHEASADRSFEIASQVEVLKTHVDAERGNRLTRLAKAMEERAEEVTPSADSDVQKTGLNCSAGWLSSSMQPKKPA